MILIVAAMREEVDAIRAQMTQTRESDHRGVRFVQGVLADRDVVLMQSGVGKGAAAMTLTMALERWQMRAVLNVGTAGGLARSADVLDLIVSERIVQYDYDTSALDGANGKGLWFAADAALAAIAKKAAEKLAIPTHFGLIASGDCFVDARLAATLMESYPQAICAEMEAGAIAQVCTHYGVPFVILRSLSDVAWKQGNELDFETYKTLASKRSAALCEQFIALLG